MALPTVVVTSGVGTTINTLQNAGQNTMANSHPVVIASDQGALPTVDPNNAAFQYETAMTLDTTYPVGRSIKFLCTVAGNISVVQPNGSTAIWSVSASTAHQTLPIAVTRVNTSGTTATATYANLY